MGFMRFYSSLSGLETLYFYCAAVGGLLLALRMILGLVGLGDHHDVDASMDSGAAELHHMGDSDASFRLLSLQGIVGFFIMFGLAGLAMTRESRVPPAWSVVGAFVAGTMMMTLIAWIVAEMRNLQSSGNVEIKNAVGQKGTIYLTIPENGSGQAQVTVQNRLRIYDAVSQDKGAIKTGERIEVVEVADGRMLIVKKVG